MVYVKGSIPTTKKWLDIFEKSFNQIKAMDHIYLFIKPEMVLIEVLQRSSEREQQVVYINRAGTT